MATSSLAPPGHGSAGSCTDSTQRRATTETWPGKHPDWFAHAGGDAFGTDAPVGFGHMRRKEDARFIRGLGNYCDDGAFRASSTVRSCARRTPTRKIVSIDTSAALAHPKVAAVVIAKDLETLGLAWMPTIFYDTQAVLAGDKVRFHLQEVAFVIALDAYSAQDALALIDVEYEVLPAIVNCRKALDPYAPLIRDDKVGQTDNLASPTWEAGDKATCDRVFAEADTVVTRDIMHARCHPCPMETCGTVADMNPADCEGLRREQQEKLAKGEMMGIGCAFFAEGVGAGPRRHMDILGLAMNDGACGSTRPARRPSASPPRPRATRRRSRRSCPTAWARTAAARPRSPAAPSPSSPARSATRLASSRRSCSRRVPRTSRGRRAAGTSRVTRSVARRSSRSPSTPTVPNPLPEGLEGGLDANAVYDPPNLTYPFGAYLAVVDIDPGTGKVHMRRVIAVDDCGVRINPLVVEGQIHGGLVEGIGQALMGGSVVDEQGNCLNASFMDYLLPDGAGVPRARVRARRDGHALPAPSDRRQGRRRVPVRWLAALHR